MHLITVLYLFSFLLSINSHHRVDWGDGLADETSCCQDKWPGTHMKKQCPKVVFYFLWLTNMQRDKDRDREQQRQRWTEHRKVKAKNYQCGISMFRLYIQWILCSHVRTLMHTHKNYIPLYMKYLMNSQSSLIGEFQIN